MQGAADVMSGVLPSIHLVLIVSVVMMHGGGSRLPTLILQHTQQLHQHGKRCCIASSMHLQACGCPIALGRTARACMKNP